MDPKVAPTGSSKVGNTKRPSPAKKWVFTWNNPDLEKDVSRLQEKFHEKGGSIHGFQYEKGESGTPHFQGFVVFNSKLRPIEAIGIKQIHWSLMHGTIPDNIKYCFNKNKPGFLAGPWGKGISSPRDLPLLPAIWKNWQEQIFEICRGEPNGRTIHWYWSEDGSIGKTTVVRRIVREFNGILTSGCAADMKCQIADIHEKSGLFPDVVCFNIPRYLGNKISYVALEEICDALFCSTKYHSGMIEMPFVHVFVFANEPPEEDYLSADRWHIVKISKDTP